MIFWPDVYGPRDVSPSRRVAAVPVRGSCSMQWITCPPSCLERSGFDGGCHVSICFSVHGQLAELDQNGWFKMMGPSGKKKASMSPLDA